MNMDKLMPVVVNALPLTVAYGAGACSAHLWSGGSWPWALAALGFALLAASWQREAWLMRAPPARARYAPQGQKGKP